MNIKNIAVYFALTAACLFGPSAKAQFTELPVAEGDMFIGFGPSTSSSISQDYLTDIGQSIYSQAPGTTVTIGNFGADLTAVFGSNWFTSGKTKWGVIGGTESIGSPDGFPEYIATIYAGHVESPYGTFPTNPGSSYFPDTPGNQLGYLNNINFLEGWYSQDVGTVTMNNPRGQIQTISGEGSWNSLADDYGVAFGEYSGFEATLATSGNDGHAIDLFQIVPDGNNQTVGTLPPTYEGRFVIDSTGTITYTSAEPASPAPEPSVITALAGGVGILGLIRRRPRPVVGEAK